MGERPRSSLFFYLVALRQHHSSARDLPASSGPSLTFQDRAAACPTVGLARSGSTQRRSCWRGSPNPL